MTCFHCEHNLNTTANHAAELSLQLTRRGSKDLSDYFWLPDQQLLEEANCLLATRAVQLCMKDSLPSNIDLTHYWSLILK